MPCVSTLAKSICAKGDGRQDRKLVRGIDALDVEGGIGLGIALGLRLAQHIGKVGAGVLHGGEDVIAGAVEDAVDPLDPVGRRAFAQALDDRDAARHRRLETQRHALASAAPASAMP
jgi:hypothetical protein